MIWHRKIFFLNYNTFFFKSFTASLKPVGISQAYTLLVPHHTRWVLLGPVLSLYLAHAGGHVQSTEGTPLIPWLWWPGNLPFLSPQDRNNCRDSSWQASIPRAVQREQTEHTPRLPVKKAYLLVLEIQPEEAGFMFATCIGVTEVPSEFTGWETASLCSALAPPQLMGTSRKGAYTLMWSLVIYLKWG